MASLHLPVLTIVIDHSRDPNSCHFEWCVIGQQYEKGIREIGCRGKGTIVRREESERRVVSLRGVVNFSMYVTFRNSYEFVYFYICSSPIEITDNGVNVDLNDALASNKNCIISRIPYCVSFFQNFRLLFTPYFIYYFHRFNDNVCLQY